MSSACVVIGPATLYLGDAYAIRPTLGGFDADVMDPPYLMDASGGGHYRKKRPAFDRLVAEGLHQGFDLSIINPLLTGAVVVFAHNDQLGPLLSHLAGSFDRQALCVWQKTNPQPIANKHYRSDVEFYAHAWNRNFHPRGTMAELLRVRRFTSVRGREKAETCGGHPTPKPLGLMASIIANVAGTSICDPFMGSGTTGVATLQAGRFFTGIEHNPDHFATALARIRATWAELEPAWPGLKERAAA